MPASLKATLSVLWVFRFDSILRHSSYLFSGLFERCLVHFSRVFALVELTVTDLTEE